MDLEQLTREELVARLRLAEEARRTLEDQHHLDLERDELMTELKAHQYELEAQNQALREAQGQLEVSRGRYVDLYDFAPIAYFTFDRLGVIREINLTGATLIGKERARIIGLPFTALVRLEDPESFRRHLRTCLDSNVPIIGQLTLTTAHGRMEAQLVSSAVLDSSGTICRSAFIDITERRTAERLAQEAHRSERALRGRLERLDRALGAVSAALARVNGADISEFLEVIVEQARRVVDAEQAELTPDATPPASRVLSIPIRYQEQSRAHLRVANKRGAAAFTEEDRAILTMLAERVAIAMEIARLRQFESREHARLEFLAKAGPLLAESIDYQTTLRTIAQLVVPKAADLSTIDLLEEDGSLRKIVAYHPDPAKQRLLARLVQATSHAGLPEGIRAALETGRPQRLDLTPEFLRDGIPDAEYREILQKVGATSTLLAPLILRGRVIGVLRLAMAESGRRYSDDDLPLAQEIAHHAALTLEAARLYQAARTAIVARDNLLAVVSHDLRNYLTTIRACTELLLRGDPASGKKQVDAIQRSVQRMDQLIESLRDATMIETGQFTIFARTESVPELVAEALATLEQQAEQRSIDLDVRLDPELPPVSCDRERVLQVIANLVGNAIKFTPEGGRIRLGAKAAPGSVCFSVADTGSGIPERQLPRVFERHWKGRQSMREGTGLGLFIAKGIVEAHGGRIWVESEVGHGSTFYFTIGTTPPTGDYRTSIDVIVSP